MRLKYIATYILFIITSAGAFAQAYDLTNSESAAEQNWVDSVFATLSRSDRVAQMMMIRAHSDNKPENERLVKQLLQKHKIGALCFFQGTPEKQAELTRTYQDISDIPLLVAMDAEWGTGMRFKSDGFSYPYQLTLGAVRDKNKIYKMGYQIGEQLRTIGVHWSFSPVVDVNTNRNNPVINYRSFGDETERVADYGISYMRGLMDAGVAASAKHFPGHGDTQVDSHHDLPVIPYSKGRLDSVELYPFKKMINAGVPSVMVGHLNIPAYEGRKQFASSLSPAIISGLLQRNLDFKGIVITDGMEMQAVVKHFQNGEAEALAIMAGNDMICLPLDAAAAIEKVLEFVDSGRIPMLQINRSVKKILRLKYRLNLHKDAYPKEFTRKSLFNAEAKKLKEELIQESLTLAKNDHQLIPIRDVSKPRIASVSFGSKDFTTFQNRLNDYARVLNFVTGHHPSNAMRENLLSQAKEADIFIAAFTSMSNHANQNHGISMDAVELLREMQKKTKVIVVLFGSPYATAYFDGFKNLIVAYQDDKLTQDYTAQAVFGAIPFKGRLPVTTSDEYQHGAGELTGILHRMGYSFPESVGMSSDTLQEIDKLMEKMIATKAAPGCQILVARHGKVIYEKSFGSHTYTGEVPSLRSNMYDVASITKIAATTLSVMQLVDDGKVNVGNNLGSYYKAVASTDKANMTIKDMMAHTAGLAAWIPYYKNTLTDKNKPNPEIYHTEKSASYSTRVSDNLWMQNNYRDSFLIEIINTPLKPRGEYKYSDLGFIMLGEMVANITGKSLDRYAADTYYNPLGLRSTTYNPLEAHYTSGNIVPTEMDDYFRYQEVHGYVHDMAAAMMGGVAGHAGLFSNTHDLAIIFQMMLNGGYYGGKRYLNEETIKLFTQRVAGSSRRGIGFDMKELNPKRSANMSEYASVNTYGHLGFTGCAAWIDPDKDLIFILLSNRTYPTMKNNKFNRESYRTEVQSIVYRSILTGESS